MTAVDGSAAHAAFEPSPAMRWLLAALSFSAAAVHLVMVPQHAEESLRMGLAFAAAGWFQIAFGAAMLAAPRRIWLWVAIVANLVFVATWAISRTVGLPDWTGDGGTETAQSADILTVVLEVAIIVGAVVLLVAPRVLERWTRPASAIVAGVAVLALVGTTAVLASPSTADHVHGSADDHRLEAAGAHDDDETAHDEATHDKTEHHEATTSADGHTHADSTITYAQLPKATKAEVDQAIAVWGNKYPTAADATSDGWFKATRNLYGIGAHYINIKGGSPFSGTATFSLLSPNILLFDGEGPDAKFAGVSYVVAEIPEGFTGPYDNWHSHTSVCTQGLTVVSLSEENSDVWLSESECRDRGGRVIPISNAQMMHLWIGPEYIDGAPIFAHDHPKLFDGFNPKRDA